MFSLTTLMSMFGLTGLFASRVFLPMFAAACVMRFGPQVGLIDDLGLLAGVSAQTPPTWFTHNLSLLVLGVLAAAEMTAHKVPESRELLNLVDRYGKPAAALVTYLGIVSVSESQFIQDVVARAGLGDVLVALLVGGGTWIVAGAHNSLMAGVMEIDEDDDTGLVGLLSWAEDIWAVFGVFFLVLFPIVMGVLILMAIGMVLLLQKRAAAREQQSRIACPHCQQPMYRSAMACANCGQTNPRPTALNWLGASTTQPADDLKRHPLDLVAKRRCPRCATRLVQRSPWQSCPACQAHPFPSEAFAADYDRMIVGRLPGVLLACGLLSLLPVIGLIPGVICYRLMLVSPYRRYLGRGSTFLLRWGVRLFFFGLLMFQWVPIAGGLVVPTMALTSYSVYRGAFHRQLRQPSLSQS